MLELQERGCHNIGFVSPTHFAPQMARGIFLAPTGSEGSCNLQYQRIRTRRRAEVTRRYSPIFICPTLSTRDSSAGYEYSKVKDYKEHSRRAILEMYVKPDTNSFSGRTVF